MSNEVGWTAQDVLAYVQRRLAQEVDNLSPEAAGVRIAFHEIAPLIQYLAEHEQSDGDDGLSQLQMEAWNRMVDIQAKRACRAEARVKELLAILDELAAALKECWVDVSNGTDDSAHQVDAALARYDALHGQPT